MTPRDYAALTPLVWEHLNPYGRFDLDMNARLALLLSKWRLVTRLLALRRRLSVTEGKRAAAINHLGSMRLFIQF